MNVSTKLHQDLKDEELTGFYLEDSKGNSISAHRLNFWQFEVISERQNGMTNTYPKVRLEELERWANDMIDGDEKCEYIPHFPATNKWSEEKTESFMKSLPAQMCDPFLKGFVLSAENASNYVVQKHINGMEWKVDGKITDFKGVLYKTRAKLNEEFHWKFEKL